MESTIMCRVAAAVYMGASEPIVEALRGIGVTVGHRAVGRSVALQEKKGFLGLGEKSVITEAPIEILSFIVCPELENAALEVIVKTGRLDIMGRGSVTSERVSVVKSHELCSGSMGEASEGERLPLLTDITGICCIVQRGQGNAVARVALDTGTCVPAITFGTGTGVRDKLGLLRITIPADKEVISLAAITQDADAVMDLMIDAGSLTEPGKGFIYLFPLSRGIINTRISIGMSKHAASMEQIIAAMDEVKGGVEWRSRSGIDAGDKVSRRRYLTNLMDMSLICDEGRADDLVKAAMSVGAAGATISKLRHLRPQDSEAAKISPAREVSNMIVGEPQIPDILAALDQAGAFDDKTHGALYSKPVPKACTYLG